MALATILHNPFPEPQRPTINNLLVTSGGTPPPSPVIEALPFEAVSFASVRLPWAVRAEHALNSFDAKYGLGQRHINVNGRLEDSDWVVFHWFLWVLGIRDDQLAHITGWGHLGGWTFTQLVSWLEHPQAYFATHPGGYIRHRARLAFLRQPHDQHITQSGLSLIEGFEGFSSTWYDDGTGTQTIGFGHTGEGGVPSPPISRAQGQALLKRDLVRYEADVKRLVHRALKNTQFDALTSFDYNLGPGCTVDIAGYINAGQWGRAADHILDYDHANGQVWPGLTRRRRAERALFLS